MTDSPRTQHYHCLTCGQTYRTADAAARGWACCGQRLQPASTPPALSPAPPVRQELYEVQPGQRSETGGRGAENLFATLGADEPYALEIASDHEGHRFLVRAPSTVMPLVLEPIRAIYPQAATRPRPCAGPGDPAHLEPGETLLAVELRLEHPPYLPLRTLRDEEFATADPLAGTLHVGSQVGLQPGERLLSQVILWPAPRDGGRRWAHLAQDAHPYATTPALRTLGGNVRAFLVLLLVVGGGAAALLGGLQLLAGQLREGLLTLAAGTGLGLPLLWGAHRLGRRQAPGPAPGAREAVQRPRLSRLDPAAGHRPRPAAAGP